MFNVHTRIKYITTLGLSIAYFLFSLGLNATNVSAYTASSTAVDGTPALSSDNNTNKWGYTLTSDPNSNTVFSPLSSATPI